MAAGDMHLKQGKTFYQNFCFDWVWLRLYTLLKSLHKYLGITYIMNIQFLKENIHFSSICSHLWIEMNSVKVHGCAAYAWRTDNETLCWLTSHYWAYVCRTDNEMLCWLTSHYWAYACRTDNETLCWPTSHYWAYARRTDNERLCWLTSHYWANFTHCSQQILKIYSVLSILLSIISQFFLFTDDVGENNNNNRAICKFNNYTSFRIS